jgi:glutamate-1-semialdehyde 2,1-aminomutase
MIDTPQARELFEHAKELLPLGSSSSIRRPDISGVPIYFDHATGPYFFDVDGHRFVDYTLGFGPLILGSNHERLNAAIEKQLRRGYTFGAAHRGELELAERLTEILPGVEHTVFATTGAEAVYAAVRIARAHTGRAKFVRFDGHYHGGHGQMLVRMHPDPERFGEAVPSFPTQPPGEHQDVLVVEWNDLQQVERVFDEHPDEIACIICEPIPNTGSCMPREGYLEGLRALCHDRGSLLIFDEVVTGFRLALGGAREFFGVEPDLSVYGKALAGGFPISAVAGRAATFEAIRDGRTIHPGTFNGNPLATTAALTTLEVLAEPGVYERMHAHGYAIRESIEGAAREAGLTLVTAGVGTSFAAMFGVSEPPANQREFGAVDLDTYDWFRREMLRRDVYVLPEGRWWVGSSHTDAELEIVREAIQASVERIADPNAKRPAPLTQRRW